MSQNKVIVPGCCEDFTAAMGMPMACVPTVVDRFVNLQMPFSKKDIALLTNMPINLFVASPDNTNDPRFGGSQSLTENSLKLIGHHLIYGIGLMLYPDISGYTAEGNLFTPRANFGAGTMPASPWVVRNPAQIIGQAQGSAVSPSAMEKGHPSWDALTAFLRAFRLKVYCPDDTLVVLIDEQCANLGSCCAVMDLEGFGTLTKTAQQDVHRLNDRLGEINTGDLRPDGIADTGYFVPCNCNQLSDGDLVPDRPESPEAAFGRPMGVPGMEFYYAFPCPLPVDSETMLKMELRSESGEQPYWQDFIDQVTMQIATQVYDNAGLTFPTVENGVAGTALATKGRIPFSRLRIGLCIKALKVAQCVCEQAKASIMKGVPEGNGRTAGILKKMCGGQACGSSCGL